MNVFSAGKAARCYQNWNGIHWNRETVAMEKWSNTAPCSCHALMRRIFFEREQEEKKQWGREGKVMERRWRLGSKEEEEKMGRRWVWKRSKVRERQKGGSCVLYVWCGSDRAGQMVSMNRIWPRLERLLQAHYFILCPPLLHPIIPPLNTSSSLSVRAHIFQMFCNYNFNFVPL